MNRSMRSRRARSLRRRRNASSNKPLNVLLKELKEDNRPLTYLLKKKCAKGTRRNKKTGKCVRRRCPNGTRKNKKTGKCEKK